MIFRIRRIPSAPALVLVVVVAGHLAAPRTAAAQGFGVTGGKTVGAGQHVLGVDVGLPSLSFTYLHGLSDRLDLGARFSFYYIFPYHDVNISLGDELAFALRYRLLQRGKFSMTLQGEIGIILDYDDGFEFGFLLVHPGLMLGYDAGPLHLFGGLSLPVTLLFGDDYTRAFIPIAFSVGTEIQLASNLNLVLRVRLGPSIGVFDSNGPWGDDTDVSLLVNATVGIQYRF